MKPANLQRRGVGCRQSHAPFACIVSALMLVGALIAMPQAALAKSYEITQVDIDAVVMPNGDLHVVEQRTFDFDGSFHGVYWDIPTGQYEGRPVTVDVESCGEVTGSGVEEYANNDSGDSGSFKLTERSSTTEVKLYSTKSDVKATYQISYTVSGGVSAWSDSGELYWKFVSDGWDEPSQNVTCTIHLPVPDGGTDTGGKIKAWGHGPLNGEVKLTSDGAVFTVPEVGTEEFAEARLAFPVQWLSAMSPASDSRMDTILSEEQQWADEANARREQARMVMLLCRAGMGILAGLTVLISIAMYLRYKREHTPKFDDTYFRDVPMDVHPAVLGTLMNGGKPAAKEFTASLMRLSDKRAVSLDAISRTTKMGRKKQDYRITRTSAADALRDPIDVATIDFLFKHLAPAALARGEEAADGFPPLDFKDIQRVAEKKASSYSNWTEDWKATVSAGCESNGFFTDSKKSHRGLMIACAVLTVLAGAFGFVGLMVCEDYLWGVIMGVACIGTVVLTAVLAVRMKPLSAEAVETMAKMKALKRWLLDFTRLKEAVPNDVILWNKLLVLAVVLGVSEEVIKQLKVALPDMMQDPAFLPTYYWCTGYGRMRSPSEAFTKSYDSAAHVSAAALAASSSSSGSGGGGGFSGGGGGGFGGGGGGGAF